MRWSVPGYTSVRPWETDASGSVSLARHMPSTSQVVIRFLPADTLRERGAAARLRADLHELGAIRHPAVPRVLGGVESDDGVAVIREHVEGAVTVRSLLGDEGALGPEAASVVLKGILAAVGAAHERSVAHRGCSPETVLVTPAGTVAVVDFAVTGARARGSLASAVPFYLAPEQWHAEPAEPALSADLYAAAATFFECLAGAPPFFATDLAQLRRAHESAPVPVDAVPPVLRDLLVRGLGKRVADRPAGAAGFLAQLELTATAAYGPDWEDRGRAELAAPAGGRGTPARLAAAELPAVLRVGRPPAWLGNPGRIAAAVAFTVVLGAQLATLGSPALSAGVDGTIGYGEAGAVAGPVGPASVDPGRTAYEWDRTERAVPLAAPADASPAPTADDDALSGPLLRGPAVPAAPGPSTLLVPAPESGPNPAATPTPRIAPPTASTTVTSVSVESFTHVDGTTVLAVDVLTTGTGPVELLLDYATRRRDEPVAIDVSSFRRTLSGATSYQVTDERPVPAACADEWLVVVRSLPATSAGAPVGHLQLDACATPRADPPASGAPASGSPPPSAEPQGTA